MRGLAILCALVGSACFGNQALDFPDGLEPLEDNVVGEPAVGQLLTESGKDRPSWGHGRARYQAPSSEVWLALQDPQNLINTWTTDKQSYEENNESAYEYSFLVHYTVDDILTVKWDEQYRYGLLEGDADTPKFGMIRYQLVYGSEFIDLIEGSYELIRIDDEVTEVQMVQHVQALSSSKDDIIDTFEHVHANLQAALAP